MENFAPQLVPPAGAPLCAPLRALLRALLCVLLFVLLLVCAALAARAPPTRAARSPRFAGGARGPDYSKSPHIVVDTLNLTHWLHEQRRRQRPLDEKPLTLTAAVIAETVDRTAAILRARHGGRVMYVVKDRESQFSDDAAREVYKRAAERNGVYLLAAERYPDPPKGVAASAEHSARGRDDFFEAVLAHRWRCAVLTEDRLLDFGRFRATVQPFHVYEFAFWRALPHREFVRPESAAYVRMKKPRVVRFANYFS
jgi:hypothetical protein